MSDFEILGDQDLFDNPTPRVPICLCLDVSDSMNGIIDSSNVRTTGQRVFRDGQWWDVVEGGISRIDRLKEGIASFYEAIKNDEVARYAAEISIVTFSDRAEFKLNFATIDRQRGIPEIYATGETSMGEGVNLALDKLLERKQHYKDVGIGYYQPWLVIMTDGRPTGNYSELVRAESRIKELVNNRKLSVFPIGVCEDADLNVLNRLSPKRCALRLKEFQFGALFEWLSQSISTTVSTSQPGEDVRLDTSNIQSWASL